MDTGDHVIVVNADKVEVTGNKREKKFAYYHSGFPGGIRAERYDRFLDEKPEKAVERAVRGMLPKNRLGRQMIKKLHVVRGGEHPHAAQKPLALAVGERPVWTGLPDVVAAPIAPATRKPPREVGADVAAEPAVPTARKLAARKPASAKKSSAKKTTAKPTATKSTAKKPTAKKPTAKKSTAKKSTTRSAAKKTTAKKTTAKRAAPKE